MPQYRALYGYAHTSAPTHRFYPLMNPENDCVATDIGVYNITATQGVLADAAVAITRRYSSDCFDLRSGEIHVLIPGLYRVELSVSVTTPGTPFTVAYTLSEIGQDFTPAVVFTTSAVEAAADIRVALSKFEFLLLPETITPSNPAILALTATQKQNTAGILTIQRVADLETY